MLYFFIGVLTFSGENQFVQSVSLLSKRQCRQNEVCNIAKS